MAKNSIKQIEEDEKKVINELLKNANKSINEIAKICGFSRQKVWRIIKNLEKNHTIWGYTAIVDEEKQNLKNYILLIKRRSSASKNNCGYCFIFIHWYFQKNYIFFARTG